MVTRANVLLVEDDTQVRCALGKALVAENYQVVAAATGQEALAGVHRTRIDIALLDLRLGKECGWEVYRKLRAIQPLLQIIVMTGWPQLSLNPLGATPVATLSKPLDLVYLFAMLARLADDRCAQTAPRREGTE